jgi:2-dehydrotetronate isomerase
LTRFAANIGFLWPDRPLLERMQAAARAGFRAVEMHFPYDVAAQDVAAMARREGLTLLGINTAVGRPGERGLAALPGREPEFQALIDQSIDYCASSGATAIHVMAGNVPAQDQERARAVFLENLQTGARKAAERNLTLLLEPLNPRENPGYFYSTLAQAVSLIEALRRPNVRLQFDVYHVAISEGDVLMKLKKYLPVIGNVQIAAVPSRAEPDEGEISFPAVFACLRDLDYGGWIGCEYRPRGDTDEGLRWRSTLGAMP